MRTSLLLLALIISLPLVAAEKTDGAPTKVADAPKPKDPPLPEKVQPPDEPPPTVSIRNVKGAVIEEY